MCCLKSLKSFCLRTFVLEPSLGYQKKIDLLLKQNYKTLGCVLECPVESSFWHKTIFLCAVNSVDTVLF